MGKRTEEGGGEVTVHGQAKYVRCMKNYLRGGERAATWPEKTKTDGPRLIARDFTVA